MKVRNVLAVVAVASMLLGGALQAHGLTIVLLGGAAEGFTWNNGYPPAIFSGDFVTWENNTLTDTTLKVYTQNPDGSNGTLLTSVALPKRVGSTNGSTGPLQFFNATGSTIFRNFVPQVDPNQIGQLTIKPAPEPSAIGALLGGLGLFAAVRRRRSS